MAARKKKDEGLRLKKVSKSDWGHWIDICCADCGREFRLWTLHLDVVERWNAMRNPTCGDIVPSGCQIRKAC